MERVQKYIPGTYAYKRSQLKQKQRQQESQQPMEPVQPKPMRQSTKYGANHMKQAPPPRYEEVLDPHARFWELGSTQPLPEFRPDDILIGVMGMTGAGKSSFISKTMGLPMEIGHGLKSCTKNIGVATSMIGGRRVHLIDTPGFDDTELADSDILEHIAAYLTHTQSHKIRLSGIIFIHRISDNRVGGTAHRNLRLFRNLVGRSSMRNVVLVTTHWDLATPKDGERRERELQNKDEFFGDMRRRGAQCDRYDRTRANGRRIVKGLLTNAPCILQIQEEIEGGVPLANTAAGRAVNEQLQELKIQHERDMQELREQLKTERDEMEREFAQKKLDDLKEKMEDAVRAQTRLQEARISDLQEQVEALQRKNQGECVIL